MTFQASESISGIQEKIHSYGLVVVAAAIPLPFYPLSNLSIVAVTLNALIAWMRTRSLKASSADKRFLILTLVFVSLYVLGVSYSDDHKAAWASVERKLPLVLLPFAVISFGQLSEKFIKWIFSAFLIACVVMSFISVYLTIARNQAAHIDFVFYNYSYFFQDSLVEEIGFHHVYFSMYMALCIVICLYFITLSKSWALRILLAVTMAWIAVYMLALSSRMGIISLTVSLIAFFLLYVKWSLPARLATLAGVIVLLIVVGYQFSFIRDKFTGLFNVEVNPYNVKYQASARLVSLDITWNIFKENWLTGVGSGDLDNLLLKKYEEAGFQEGIIHRYNPHNQYLDTAATVGIAGLLILLAGIGYLFYRAIRTRSFIALSFAMIMSLSLITESMLARQRGVVFLALWSSVLFIHRRDRQSAIMAF